MFNDFKRLTYNATKQKIRRLKDIFDRLNLSKLEERYNRLLDAIDLLDVKVTEFNAWYQETITNPPTPPGGEPPVEPPEEELLPDLTVISIIPTVYSNNVNFTITIQNTGHAISPISNLSTVIPDLFNNTISIKSLAINEIFVTNVQYDFDPNGEPETVNVNSTINPSHSINEESFSNNTAVTSVLVKKAYVNDPPDPGDPNGFNHTYVVFHAHNPEGKEIAPFAYPVVLAIHRDSYNIDYIYSPTTLGGHGLRQHIYHPGTYHCYATFNFITIDLGVISFLPYTTTIVTATFTRTEFEGLTASSSGSNTYTTPTSYNVPPVVANFSKYYGDETGLGQYSYSFSLSSWNMFIRALITAVIGNGAVTMQFALTEYVINIPAQSFQQWFCQCIKSGNYPPLAVSIIPDNSHPSLPRIRSQIITSANGLQNNAIAANITGYQSIGYLMDAYTILEHGDIGGVGGNIAGGSVTANMGFPNSTPDVSVSSSGGIANFHISSIPYDILGTSF